MSRLCLCPSYYHLHYFNYVYVIAGLGVWDMCAGDRGVEKEVMHILELELWIVMCFMM